MRIITFEREILETKIINVADTWIEAHRRQWTRLTRELEARLFEMIRVKVQIAERVHEGVGPQAADLRDHECEQCVARDVEWDAEEEIRAALVKLATQSAIMDVELKQRVTRRQRHLVDLADV